MRFAIAHDSALPYSSIRVSCGGAAAAAAAAAARSAAAAAASAEPFSGRAGLRARAA
jgi:hypothetical protein